MSRRVVVEERTIGAETFRLERVYCGKPRCKCLAGGASMHGPYWYAYRRVNGRMVSTYIGVSLEVVGSKRLREGNPRKRNN